MKFLLLRHFMQGLCIGSQHNCALKGTMTGMYETVSLIITLLSNKCLNYSFCTSCTLHHSVHNQLLPHILKPCTAELQCSLSDTARMRVLLYVASAIAFTDATC